jgi:hypothetical protein
MNVRRALIAALGVSVVTGLAYLSALPGAFHFDDYHSIVNNPMLEMADTASVFTRPEIFSGLGIPMYRPVTVWSFAVQYGPGGPDPGPLVAVNIFLHAACAGLFFGIAVLLSRSLPKAAVASLVFGLHPIQSQAVNYISCRSTLLASCLAMAALLLLLASLNRRGLRAAAVYICSLLLFGLALLSKSEVFTAALIPVLFTVFLRNDDGYSIRNLSRGAFFFLMVAALYLSLRSLVGVDVIIPSRPVRPILINLATGARASLNYLALILWPTGLSVVHDLKPSASLWDLRAAFSVIIFLTLLACAYVVRDRNPLVLLGLSWFILGLLPTHTLVPLRSVMAEHRLYFGMAGISLAAGELIGGLLPAGDKAGAGLFSRRAVAVFIAFFMLMVSWAALAQQRNRDWQSELRLWLSAAERAPESSTSWVNLGVAFWEAGKVTKSRAAFEKTLAFDPDNLQAKTNLGRIYVDDGRLDEGIRLMEEALSRARNEPQVHYNLARAYAMTGRHRLAEAHYLETLKRMRGHITACLNLAEIYVYNIRDVDKARELIPRCWALRPSFEEESRIRRMIEDLSRLEQE